MSFFTARRLHRRSSVRGTEIILECDGNCAEQTRPTNARRTNDDLVGIHNIFAAKPFTYDRFNNCPSSGYIAADHNRLRKNTMDKIADAFAEVFGGDL